MSLSNQASSIGTRTSSIEQDHLQFFKRYFQVKI